VWDKNVGAIHELPLHFLFFLCGGHLKTAILRIICVIDNSKSIVSFGESEQKAINNSKQKLKQHLLNHKFDENQAEDIIQSCKTETEIISPWGGNISLWNQVAILRSKR